MTALLVYQHQITHTANLIWILYVPSGLLLGGGFLYYRYRSHVSVQEDGVKVSTLMNSVLLEYDSIKSVKAQPLRQHFMDRRSRMIAPVMKQYVDKPALFIRIRGDETELAAMHKRLGSRLMDEDTIAVPVPDADAVAFVLRFYSPIMPDFLVHPFQGPAITNCVPNTPIDPKGDPGTICGLAYPFNRGYADSNGVLSPPNGQVFDEIYFPVDAYDDVKGIELCRPSTVSCKYNYFDPEPPLPKLFIASGEWVHASSRAPLLRAPWHS